MGYLMSDFDSNRRERNRKDEKEIEEDKRERKVYFVLFD